MLGMTSGGCLAMVSVSSLEWFHWLGDGFALIPIAISLLYNQGKTTYLSCIVVGNGYKPFHPQGGWLFTGVD